MAALKFRTCCWFVSLAGLVICYSRKKEREKQEILSNSRKLPKLTHHHSAVITLKIATIQWVTIMFMELTRWRGQLQSKTDLFFLVFITFLIYLCLYFFLCLQCLQLNDINIYIYHLSKIILNFLRLNNMDMGWG